MINIFKVKPTLSLLACVLVTTQAAPMYGQTDDCVTNGMVGTFVEDQLLGSGKAEDVAFGDFNNDGLLDVMLVCQQPARM